MIIPNHVAIIMDRNGEWAKKRSLARAAGHRAGADAVKRSVKAAIKYGVNYLSIYAFSTENWERPAEEVSFLMSLLEEFIVSSGDELVDSGVKLLVSGRKDRLPKRLLDAIEKVVNTSEGNTKLILNVALDYGGRTELVEAFRKIAAKNIAPATISEADIAANLYLPELPDVDLLVRTGGEQRVSNFMLWQISYAELYFPDVLWPDFTENDFADAIEVFSGRKRRFGKTDEQI